MFEPLPLQFFLEDPQDLARNAPHGLHRRPDETCSTPSWVTPNSATNTLPQTRLANHRVKACTEKSRWLSIRAIRSRMAATCKAWVGQFTRCRAPPTISCKNQLPGLALGLWRERPSSIDSPTRSRQGYRSKLCLGICAEVLASDVSPQKLT